MKTHQPKPPKKSYSCLECDKNFPYPSQLNRHINGVHKSSCKRKIDFQQEEVLVVTVGGPTTEEKNPGQQSTDAPALSVSADSIGKPPPKKTRRKQQLVERTEFPI